MADGDDEVIHKRGRNAEVEVESTLSATSFIGTEDVARLKNERLEDPPKKRIRLSLKGPLKQKVCLVPSSQVDNKISKEKSGSHGESSYKQIKQGQGREFKDTIGGKPIEAAVEFGTSEEKTPSLPKKKIKIVLGSIPEKRTKESIATPASQTLPLLQRNTTGGTRASDGSGDVPEAMPLESNEDGDLDAVAAVVDHPSMLRKPKDSLPNKLETGTDSSVHCSCHEEMESLPTTFSHSPAATALVSWIAHSSWYLSRTC